MRYCANYHSALYYEHRISQDLYYTGLDFLFTKRSERYRADNSTRSGIPYIKTINHTILLDFLFDRVQWYAADRLAREVRAGGITWYKKDGYAFTMALLLSSDSFLKSFPTGAEIISSILRSIHLVTQLFKRQKEDPSGSYERFLSFTADEGSNYH